MRRVATVLAQRGVTPVHDRIDQSWHTRAGSPTKHRSFMDPYGTENCAALVNKIVYPASSLTFHQVITDVVPRVIESVPMDLSRTTGKPGRHMIAPYLWTVDLATPRTQSTFTYHPDLREIVFTSPHYYFGYVHARGSGLLSSRHWPLDLPDGPEPGV